MKDNVESLAEMRIQHYYYLKSKENMDKRPAKGISLKTEEGFPCNNENKKLVKTSKN